MRAEPRHAILTQLPEGPAGPVCLVALPARDQADRAWLHRALVGRLTGCDPADVAIVAGETGALKLLVPAAPLFLSRANRGGTVLLAVADEPIGVDLEVDDGGPVADAVLSDSDRAMIEALPPEERPGFFIRLWAAREAYLKRLGEGIAIAEQRLATHRLAPEIWLVVDRGRGVSADVAVWPTESGLIAALSLGSAERALP